MPNQAAGIVQFTTGLHGCAGLGGPRRELLAQLGQALAGAAADEQPAHLRALDLDPIGQPVRALRGLERIELVEDQQLRHLTGADLVQHALHLFDLLGVVRVGRVDHVQQQVGIGGFLQRGLERIDQAVRQVADEPDRVGQRHRAAAGAALLVVEVEPAGGGVQRGEQLVGRIGARLDQRVEERGLAGVGVADQRDVEGALALALAPLGVALALDLLQPLACALDGVADHPAVQLDLLLARAAAHAGAAGLPLQVRPAPHQPGADVLQPRQLDLQLAFVAAGALGEDLQDQQRAVVDRKAEVALEVALLRRG